MKRIMISVVLLVLAIGLTYQQRAEAQQQYFVKNSVFGSGGGVIENGSYRVVGTVGQPMIGVVSAPSNIKMSAGFWYLIIKPAIIVITPDTWHTEWADDPRGNVRCYLGDLSDGYEVTEIDINTVKLNNIVPANTSRYRIKDSQEGFTGKVLEVMFNRHDAFLTLGAVSPGDIKIVEVSGQLSDGSLFQGGTTITVQTLNAAPKLLPIEFALHQNYPNPWNPETWIPYQLPKSAQVRLTIYDLQGQLVKSVELGYQKAGLYTTKDKAIYWDGRNSQGETVASGIYFYQIQAGDFQAVRKMIMLK